MRAVVDSRVVFVLMDGREITPSAYQFWAYAHLALGLLVAAAIVLAWMRTREVPAEPAVAAQPAVA